MTDASDTRPEQDHPRLRIRRGRAPGDDPAQSGEPAFSRIRVLATRASAGDGPEGDGPGEQAKPKAFVEQRPAKRGKSAAGRSSTVPRPAKAVKNAASNFAPDTGDGDGLRRGKPEPTDADRKKGTALFREIGKRFNENRKISKSAAYANYRHDLMANLDTLVMSGAIDLKEITTVITNLEAYTRESEHEGGKSQAQMLAEWLKIDVKDLRIVEPAAPELPE
jgi:hypothetical protein